MTRMDRYMLRQFLTTYVFILGIFIVVILVIDFAEKLGIFIDKNIPTREVLWDYYLNFIPFFANLLNPIVVFLAAILVVARMANQSEIVALVSSGAGYYRLLWPFIIGALAITGFSYYLNAHLVPQTMNHRMDFEYRWLENPDRRWEARHIYIRLSPQDVIYFYAYNQWDSTGQQFAHEHFGPNYGPLLWRQEAAQARWNGRDGSWVLHNTNLRTFDGQFASLKQQGSVVAHLDLTPDDIYQRKNFVKTLDIIQLNDYIRQERQRRSELLESLETEYHERIALPFAAVILTIIAFALASRKRRGGIAPQLGIGFILSFAYVVLLSIARLLVGPGLPVWLAMWLPNLLFLVLGVILLRLAPK